MTAVNWPQPLPPGMVILYHTTDHLQKAHCTIWLASLEYSEKHKTILKYQQAMATSTHEKMGFEIQIGDIIISPSPLWAKMEIQFERASLLSKDNLF